MEEEQFGSPWSVTNLEEFLYFCCPECEVRDQSKEDFVKHASEEHPPTAESAALEAAEQMLRLSSLSPLPGTSALASALMESTEIPIGIFKILSACLKLIIFSLHA